jgi:hypothetical protein
MSSRIAVRVLAVFQDNTSGSKLVTDTVRFLEILSRARGSAIRNESSTLPAFDTAFASALATHAQTAQHRGPEMQVHCRVPPKPHHRCCDLLPQRMQLRDNFGRIQVIGQSLDDGRRCCARPNGAATLKSPSAY